MLSNLNNILVLWFCIYRYTNLLTNNLQLLNSCRTINVTSNKQRILVSFIFQTVSKLSTKCCFTRTLQTTHQNNRRMSLEINLNGITTHKLSQFIVNNLHHQLTWLNSSKHIHTKSLFLYSICKGLSYFVVYIGIKEGTTNVL